MEEWREIEENINYEVSSLGRIRNKNNKNILKLRKNNNGRFYVDLGRQMKMKSVARLVAIAFISKINGKNEIDHINRDCSDNRVSNLRWVNRSENVQNTKNRGTSTGERCIYKTPTSYLVQIMRNSKYVYRKNFNTLEEAIQNRNSYLNNCTQTQTQTPCIQDQPLIAQ